MKKKVCKICRIFVDGHECPICKGSQFTTNWQGRLNIIDANHSYIAEKTSIKVNGEYAIKAK